MTTATISSCRSDYPAAASAASAENYFARLPQSMIQRLAEGKSQSTIARSLNVDRATISRLARA
jgi:DNA-binding NarL/FixJ family response regulator